MQNIFGAPKREQTSSESEQWISVSDLMAGLMMVFLFISIALMRVAMQERKETQEFATDFQDQQKRLYQALKGEFGNDLEQWDARIEQKTLAFVFNSPDVLFDTGKSSLKPRFQSILEDFFPRYMKVLDDFWVHIDEVRIEGHTSSVWNVDTSRDNAYFFNMDLSQERTRAVLEYCYRIPSVGQHRDRVREKVSAVGLSSSKLVVDERGNEDRERSRRVTFRAITDAEAQLRKIAKMKSKLVVTKGQ